MSFLNRFTDRYTAIIDSVSTRYMDDMLHNINKLEKVYNLLSDEDSKKTFESEITMLILRNFLKGDLPSYYAGLMTNKEWNSYMQQAEYNNIYPELKYPELPNAKEITTYCKAATFILEQYRYKDKVQIAKGDICIDAGACLGDTSLYFFQNGAEKSFAFEIDKNNIASMIETFQNFDYKLSFVNKALSNKNDKMYYLPRETNLGGGTVSITQPDVAAEKYYEVKCITLDDFCKEQNIQPNFIKMDIEGSELIAIEGAKNILASARPKFAICIYHRWQHRWEIPLLLNDILPDYNFFLKKSHPVCETVLFGCPKSI